MPAAGAPEPIGAEAFVRVDVATAHHLAEEASEAVIAQARYRHGIDCLRRGLDELARVIITRTGNVEAIQGIAERMKETVERLADDIHEADATIRALEIDSRRLRMVPLAPLFRSQMRSVRSLAQELGKLATVHINDGNIAVD